MLPGGGEWTCASSNKMSGGLARAGRAMYKSDGDFLPVLDPWEALRNVTAHNDLSLVAPPRGRRVLLSFGVLVLLHALDLVEQWPVFGLALARDLGRPDCNHVASEGASRVGGGRY
jgi:hypothetical protein